MTDLDAGVAGAAEVVVAVHQAGAGIGVEVEEVSGKTAGLPVGGDEFALEAGGAHGGGEAVVEGVLQGDEEGDRIEQASSVLYLFFNHAENWEAMRVRRVVDWAKLPLVPQSLIGRPL